MKFSILFVLLLALAAHSDDDLQLKIRSLLGQLEHDLVRAHVNGKSTAIAMINQIGKLVQSVARNPESPESIQALQTAEKAIYQVEAILSDAPVSRSGLMSTLGNIIAQRKNLILGNLAQAVSNLRDQGMGALASIMDSTVNTMRNQLLSNEDLKNALTSTADVLDMAEQALGFLNNISGGLIVPLNAATGVVHGLNKASDFALGCQDDDESNVLSSKALSFLLKAKNSGNQQAFETIEKVCSGIRKVQTAESRTQNA